MLSLRKPLRIADRSADHSFHTMTILLCLIFVAIMAGPWLFAGDPNEMDFAAVLHPPSTSHILGTDDLGRDIWNRMLYGAQLSLLVSTCAVLMAVAIGLPIGIVSGYSGGLVDEGLMRILDSFMSLPPLVLALTISAVLGPGLVNAILAIGIVASPTFARLVRGQTLSVRRNDYIAAAECSGLPVGRIIVFHVLPNVVGPLLVHTSIAAGTAVIIESSLSFIGLGAQPPVSTLGSMVQVGFQYLVTAPWFVIAPSLMIFLIVLGFNLLSHTLHKALES